MREDRVDAVSGSQRGRVEPRIDQDESTACASPVRDREALAGQPGLEIDVGLAVRPGRIGQRSPKPPHADVGAPAVDAEKGLGVEGERGVGDLGDELDVVGCAVAVGIGFLRCIGRTRDVVDDHRAAGEASDLRRLIGEGAGGLRRPRDPCGGRDALASRAGVRSTGQGGYEYRGSAESRTQPPRVLHEQLLPHHLGPTCGPADRHSAAVVAHSLVGKTDSDHLDGSRRAARRVEAPLKVEASGRAGTEGDVQLD